MSINSRHEQYRQDGFYIQADPILTEHIVQQAVSGMDAIRQGEYDTGRPPCPSLWNPSDDVNVLCKIENPQFASIAIRDLITIPVLGEFVAEVTGAEAVQIWWIQLLYKPPIAADYVAATNVGIHQDWTYWRNSWADGSEVFTAWVALSDVTAISGPMKFVRASHQWGILEESDFFEQDLEAQQSTIQATTNQPWEEVQAILSPGGVSVHHSLAYHGSGPNQSTLPRRSLAIHMRTQNSAPRAGKREGLTRFIKEHDVCPVIYGDAAAMDHGA